jgi:hypothetical protein
MSTSDSFLLLLALLVALGLIVWLLVRGLHRSRLNPVDLVGAMAIVAALAAVIIYWLE